MTSTADWIGVEALAGEFDVPRSTIYSWRSAGKGPRGYRLGKHVRFKRADVDAWLEQHADPVP